MGRPVGTRAGCPKSGPLGPVGYSFEAAALHGRVAPMSLRIGAFHSGAGRAVLYLEGLAFRVARALSVRNEYTLRRTCLVVRPRTPISCFGVDFPRVAFCHSIGCRS